MPFSLQLTSPTFAPCPRHPLPPPHPSPRPPPPLPLPLPPPPPSSSFTSSISILFLHFLLLLSKLPRRTLAELLAPSSVMVDRKFELRVDEWRFVGHPFSLQTEVWSASFNVVFLLQVSDPVLLPSSIPHLHANSVHLHVIGLHTCIITCIIHTCMCTYTYLFSSLFCHVLLINVPTVCDHYKPPYITSMFIFIKLHDSGHVIQMSDCSISTTNNYSMLATVLLLMLTVDRFHSSRVLPICVISKFWDHLFPT